MFFVISDFDNLLEFMNLYKMSNIEDSVKVDLSEIKGKPVDAVGHLIFQIDFDHFKSPFCIEKIFGLVDTKTNAVFKFKLVVNEDGPRKINFKLIYVSEEPIDCKIKIDHCPSAIVEHLTIGDELKTYQYMKENLKIIPIVDFGLSVLVITTTSMNNVIAEKFNEPSTSDFRIYCQGKHFYVHQRILREKSEFFKALLSNDCIEKRDKMLQIDDFPPKIVEIFLGCFYNGALPISASLLLGDMIHLIRIADKYNANKLFDALDSYISQESLFILNILDNDKKEEKLILLKDFLETIKEVQAPKFTTMIYEWRRTKKGSNSLDDNQWSSLIRGNPNFAALGGITVGRNDYQSWAQQHISWSLTSADDAVKGRNNFSVLVGPIGEMKGAVKCSLI